MQVIGAVRAAEQQRLVQLSALGYNFILGQESGRHLMGIRLSLAVPPGPLERIGGRLVNWLPGEEVACFEVT